MNNFITVFSRFLTTLILTFDGSVGWTSDKGWTFGFFSSAISISTFIRSVDWTRYNSVTLLDTFYTVSLWAFNGFLFRTTSSGTAFNFIIDTFTIPAVILSFLANSYYTLVFGFSTTIIWASNSIQRATIDCRAHENTISAFSSGTNYFISTFSAVNCLVSGCESSS